jgi:thioesterase domain-containing protein
VPEIGAHDDFFDLGGHSLLAVRLAAQVEAELGRRVPVSSFFGGMTVARMAAALGSPIAESARSPLVTLRAGDGPLLVLVHPIGGQLLCYRELVEGLTGPVWGLEVPDTTCVTVEAMADRYCAALDAARAPHEMVLAGWSFGGLVALEMARRLGPERIAHVVLLDSHLARERAVDDEALVALSFLRDLLALSGAPPSRLGLLVADAAELGASALLERAAAERLLPSGFDAATLRAQFEVFAANHRAAGRYRPAPVEVPVVSVEASAEPPEGASRWSALARAGLEVRHVVGDHYNLLRAPQVARVAEVLGALLARPREAR